MDRMLTECRWCRGTGQRAITKWSDEMLVILLTERRDGMTWDGMAEMHGVTYQRIQQLVNKARQKGLRPT